MSESDKFSEQYFREKLSPEEYYVLREKGTERPFTGAYWNVFADGQYHCRACGETLFEADTKFDAGCGWPSFFAPVNGEVIREEFDASHGMRRTEVLCKNCGSHLGHVFPDGPEPTGLRYCINSASIDLEENNQS